MLEHVALGQTRFMTPGVTPDPRGVVLGRYALLVFPTLEGVVSWFRLYSAEASIDELIPSLEITRGRTPLSSRELLVRIPATSSYTCDRAARLAKLVGGSIYTGTSKHFVKYRDDRSPYGYDAVDIQALPQGADLMVHGSDFSQSYASEGQIAFDKLLFRLSLRRVPGGVRPDSEERAELLVTVARGLGEGVIRYLWRNRIRAEVGLVRPLGERAFDDAGADRGYLLMRVYDLPERVLDLFVATPGIDVFRLASSGAAVELGYAHVIDLSSCATLFEGDRFHLFWGKGDRVDVLPGPLELSAIEHLTSVSLELDNEAARQGFAVEEPASIGVAIELAPSLSTSRHVRASLVPLSQLAWVKKLVYLLPPTILRGHRVAVTDRGVLLIARDDIDIIPLGQLMCEHAPGLLVPLGMDLVPRVAPEVLAKTLGHGAGMLTVFPVDGPPFQLNEASLEPLERRTVAKIEVERTEITDVHLDPPGDPTVVNAAVGRFALWGFPEPNG